MNALLAVLDFTDFAIIAFIVIVFTSSASLATRRRLDRVERKMDALLQHHGIKLPSSLSAEAQRMASDPNNRTTAIMLHQEENPELSPADVKREIENFAKSKGPQ